VAGRPPAWSAFGGLRTNEMFGTNTMVRPNKMFRTDELVGADMLLGSNQMSRRAAVGDPIDILGSDYVVQRGQR
jgi:hypothetical protein